MAIKAGIGLSTTRDHILAAREATNLALRNIFTDKVDLAIVFSTVDFAHPGTLKIISGLLGQVPILGCSGLAVISNQGIAKHGLAILLLSLSEGTYFNVAAVKEIKAKTPLVAGEELGEKLLYGCKNVRRDLSVIFSDGLIDDSSSFVNGLQARLGRSFPLVGGSASDNLAFEKTFIYFNQEALSDASCGMLLGGKLKFGLGTKHGWKALGKPRRVTKAQGNIVETIEDEPAVKIYTDYLAKNMDELKKDAKRVSILYPIGMYLAGEDEYLLRNILSIEDNGSLIFQGDLPQDSQVRLMIGTKESCLEAAVQATEEVKMALGGAPINFAILFDSASRYMLLGRQANKEVDIIKRQLGKETPLIGIYTYGEQSPLTAINYLGRSYFHNQTITILGIGG